MPVAVSPFVASAHIAKAEDLPEIRAFYERETKLSPTVHLREDAKLMQAIENGLFVVVRDDNFGANGKGDIAAASAIYILNDGRPLPYCRDINSGRIKSGVVAELGSVMRRKFGDRAIDKVQGWAHPVLFTIPALLLLDKLMKPSDLPRVDSLLADVQSQIIDASGQIVPAGRNTRMRLTGHAQPSPLKWVEFEETPELSQAKKGTVRHDDGQINNDRQYYTMRVSTIVESADFVRLLVKQGLQGRYVDSPKLPIDMREIYEQLTIDVANGNRVTLLDALLADARFVGSVNGQGWADFANNYDPIRTPRIIRPSELAPGSDYHAIRPDEPILLRKDFRKTRIEVNGSTAIAAQDSRLTPALSGQPHPPFQVRHDSRAGVQESARNDSVC